MISVRVIRTLIHLIVGCCSCFGFGVGLEAALVWHQEQGFRVAPLSVSAGGRAGFSAVPSAQTGITFSNVLSDDKAAENQIRMIGSGVALGDVDGDGWCDIYFARLDGPNVLYRNLGNWKFEDITAAAGVGCPEQYSTGVAFADVDGDGDLDLLVNSIGGGTRLFLNDGKGHFSESLESGLIRRFCATSMALADIDGDGDLDLYVANYRTTTVRSTGMTVLNVNGKRTLRPQDRDDYEITPTGLILEHGEVDVLYLNDGKGHFSPVSWTGGAFLDEDGQPLKKPPQDWGLSVMLRDLNGDGAPDIYVCNDFWSPDRIWFGDGKGGFRAAPRLAIRHTCTFSMGVDVADINRDGWDDLLVLDMLSRDHPRRMRQTAMAGQSSEDTTGIEDRPQVGRNTLLLNRGDGTFADVAELAGVNASEWSWGVVFIDVDLDGFEDVLITNGHLFDPQDIDADRRIAAQGPRRNSEIGRSLLQYPRLNVPKVAFRNRGELIFEEVSREWGFDGVGIAHGIALADLDNDGDLDVVVNNLNTPATLYRNESSSPRLAMKLRGVAPNTQGVGAAIEVRGRTVNQSQKIISGGRYLSSDEPRRVFAAGNGPLTVVVTWPDGKQSFVSNAAPDCLYELDQRASVKSSREPHSKLQPVFREATNLFHVHKDLPFDDFQRQPLLTRKLSGLGPGIAWCDLDGDGYEELLITSGRGGELAVFENQRGSVFSRAHNDSLPKALDDDQTGVLAFATGDGETRMLVGSANYETVNTNLPGVLHFGVKSSHWIVREPLVLGASSPGPMVVADVDGDGDLDLFVGGRCIAGRYPEAAASRLFLEENGTFQARYEWPKLGLITGAVFSDLDGDGFPELIVSCDWGSLRVFHNDRSGFSEITTNLGLDQFRGWWNGVTTGDFDGDGKLDIVAANWGHNSGYESYLNRDFRIYFGDLSGAGMIDGLETYWNATYKREVPWRNLETLSRAMPWLREKFSTAAAFGAATLDEVLGDRKAALQMLKVNWLQSTVFLNRGDKFEARPLPLEAQFSPAFALCVGDCNADGSDDLFLSQNFFQSTELISRDDAGRGLWLVGNGKGQFRSLSAAESGVAVYGEQRGAALCDFDHDGRVDLVVSQNNSTTRLFRNESEHRCLRVRLKGPPRNPTGIGAIIRIRRGDTWGPAREIHGGGGYWSQDSVVQLFGGDDLNAIEVLWPGGSRKVSPLVNARELEVDTTGSVRKIN